MIAKTNLVCSLEIPVVACCCCHTFMFSLVLPLSSFVVCCFVLYCINLYSLFDVMIAINERYCLKWSRGPVGPDIVVFTLH